MLQPTEENLGLVGAEVRDMDRGVSVWWDQCSMTHSWCMSFSLAVPVSIYMWVSDGDCNKSGKVWIETDRHKDFHNTCS